MTKGENGLVSKGVVLFTTVLFSLLLVISLRKNLFEGSEGRRKAFYFTENLERGVLTKGIKYL